MAETNGVDLEILGYPAKVEIDEPHDWITDPKGEGYRSALKAGGINEALGSIDGLRGEHADKLKQAID